MDLEINSKNECLVYDTVRERERERESNKKEEVRVRSSTDMKIKVKLENNRTHVLCILINTQN